MKIFDYTAQKFSPISLQALIGKETSSEYSHLEKLIEKSQQKVREQASLIASNVISETSTEVSEDTIIGLIESLADSMLTTGLETVVPFSEDTLSWMLDSFEKAGFDHWEHILNNILSAAQLKLSFEQFLLFEAKVVEALHLIRRIKVAVEIDKHSIEIAQAAARNFINFCRIEDPEIDENEVENLQFIIESYLSALTQMMKFWGEVEIEINICRFWAEQFAPRYDCSLQQWQFLIASIEQAIYQKIGAKFARTLTSQFLLLYQAVMRLPFCGVYYRHYDQIASKISSIEHELSFDWKGLMQVVMGEILLSASLQKSILPFQCQLIRTHKPLGGVSSATFEKFMSLVINSCRPLSERHWLDWLDSELVRALKAVRFIEGRTEAAESIRSVVEAAAVNLRQALDIFYSNTTLEKDLALIIDAVQRAFLVAPTINEAKIYFRRWFASLYAIRQANDVWQHAKTIVSAIRTSAKQNGEGVPFWGHYSSALTILDDIPDIVSDAQFVVKANKELLSKSLFNELEREKFNFNSFLHTVLSDYACFGQMRAWYQSLETFLERELSKHEPQDLDLNQVDQLLGKVHNKLKENPVFAEKNFNNCFSKIVVESTATVLSYRLWAMSDEIGEEIATNVYEMMPRYREKTGGETGISKCARDNAITLRRLSLAFEPKVIDRLEFLDSWWNNLVNNYIYNRPAKLFQTNSEQMIECCRKHFTQEATILIEAVIQPIYLSASTDLEEETDKVELNSLVYKYPLFQETTKPSPDMKAFISSAAKAAQQYADEKGGQGSFVREHADVICHTILEGLMTFEQVGILSIETTEKWQSILMTAPNAAITLERFLIGLLYNSDSIDGLIKRLRVMDYIQALIEFTRQSAAASQLRGSITKIAEKVTLTIHQALLEELKEGVSAPSREKCSRDLEYIYGALCDAFEIHPHSIAILQINRYLIEQLSPYIGYGEKIWKVVWRTSAEVAEGVLTSTVLSEFRSWTRELQSIGKTMSYIGKLSENFISNHDPIFSSNPDEENHWRQAICAIFALIQIRKSSPKHSTVARLILCESLAVVSENDFADKLDAVLRGLKDWYPDTDISLAEKEFEEFKATEKKVKSFKQFQTNVTEVSKKATEKSSLLGQVAFSEVEQLLTSLALVSISDSRGTSSRWGVARIAKFVEEKFLDTLEKITDADFDKLRSVLDTILSAYIPTTEQMLRDIDYLRRLSQTRQDFINAWTSNWSFNTSEFGSTCRRDLYWTARRISVDGWFGIENGVNALDWYTNEVIPFATDIDTKLYIDAMKAINSSFRINPSISRHMKLVAREFCNRMQALLTASMKHSELAERVVANVDIAMTGFRPLFAEDRLLAVVLEETEVTFTNEPDISQFLLSYAKNAFQYASRNSRTLKDFAIADKIEIETSFSDGSEFVSANIGFICSTIAKSMVSFEWNGLLPSSLTENWNSLIKICPASGICLERLLIGFVYSTSNIKAVASRLRILDYLQALIEFTRQCSAGIELGNNVLRLASKVAEQIDLTGAAELRQGVSSPSREKCSRDLSYILNALAEGLSSMARPVALLHINRYLIEQVSPFVGYEEAVWRITWRTVATVAEEILAPASCRELKRMCKELENIGKTMPFIGSIARTYTYEQHVQFSEDIHQESDWRQLLCSLLALIQTKESCPDYLSSLRMVLAESILLTEREDFTAELNLLLNQMRDLFIDLDLRQIQSEVEAFRSTVSNIDLLFKLCHTVDEIRRRLVERLPVFGSLASSQRELNFFLLSLAKLSLSQRSHSSTRWTLPQIMTLSSSKVTDTLSNISNSDFERLQAALINSLASYLPSTENLAEQLQNLRRLVLNEKELNTVWIEEWQIEGKEFDETCRRDLQWMARRICFDGWKGDLAASGAIGWYSNEVVPYAGTIQPKIYAKAIRAVTERIQASSRVSQEMKQASSNFRSKMEAALSKQRGYETAEQLLLGDLAASSKEERVEKKSWWSKLTDSIAGRS